MAPCIGIDVSKHTLDWSSGSKGRIQSTRNVPRSIAALVRRLSALRPKRIVVESTGGYERQLVLKLAEAKLPVVVVNPRRVRSFGEAVGCLAKTDPIDARLLSQFGEKVEPPLRPIVEGRERLLADLVARRRQLVSMVVAEKNRRECAPAAVRRSITAVLKMPTTVHRRADGKDPRRRRRTSRAVGAPAKRPRCRTGCRTHAAHRPTRVGSPGASRDRVSRRGRSLRTR